MAFLDADKGSLGPIKGVSWLAIDVVSSIGTRLKNTAKVVALKGQAVRF